MESSSISSYPQAQECIGTVQILIHDANGRGNDGVGFAALYRDCGDGTGSSDVHHSRNNNINEEARVDASGDGDGDGGGKNHADQEASLALSPLTLWVTDGRRTFHTRITSDHLSSVKIKKEQLKDMGYENIVDWMTGVILQKQNNSKDLSQTQTQCQTQSQSLSQSSALSSSQPLLQPMTLVPIRNESVPSSSVEYSIKRGGFDAHDIDMDDMNADESICPDTVGMIIKHVRGKLVRVVSKQTLHQVKVKDPSASASASAPIPQSLPQLQSQFSLPFIEQITSTLHQTQDTIHTLKKQQRKTNRQLNSWKTTATKLSFEHWEQEREDMMGRFVTLINRVKKDLRNTQSELDAQVHMNASLERKVESLEMQLASSKNTDHHHKLQPRTLMVDDIDQHDCEIFDDDEVDLLAKGKRLKEGTRSRGIGNKASRRDSSTVAKTTKTISKGRAAVRFEERKRKRATLVYKSHAPNSSSSVTKNASNGHEHKRKRKATYSDHGDINTTRDDDEKMPAVDLDAQGQPSPPLPPFLLQDQSQKFSSLPSVPPSPSKPTCASSSFKKKSMSSKKATALGISTRLSTGMGMRRKNQTTGNIEVWGTDGLFPDSDGGSSTDGE